VRRTRIAVIGTGHLGKSHARILAELPEASLCGIVDAVPERAAEFGGRYGVPWATDFRQTPGSPEAVSIAVPTRSHAEVAQWFLSQGVDVLVEKPITDVVADAKALVQLADTRGRILQVGHIERFNPTVRAVRELNVRPRYIEAQRMAPFSFRSVDSGVVLDLMIHDIDLARTFFTAPLESVTAFGGAVFTEAVDMASAILQFHDGAAAHFVANRAAFKPLRRMRLFSPDSYVSLDFGERSALIVQKAPGWDLRKLELHRLDLSKVGDLQRFVFEGLLLVREIRVSEGDALREELRAFLLCCQNRTRPEADGAAGLEALEIAHRVLAAITARRW
jgi:predicted dehydrogenase